MPCYSTFYIEKVVCTQDRFLLYIKIIQVLLCVVIFSYLHYLHVPFNWT